MRSIAKALRTAICLAILLSAWCATVLAQAVVGTVTMVAGDVKVTRAGTTTAARQGMAVDQGDQFVTGPGASVTVTLKDQTKLELGESSTMMISEQTTMPNGAARTRIGLVYGLMRWAVNYTAGANHPDFEVHTPNAVAAARGTEGDTRFAHETRKEFPHCLDFTDQVDRVGDIDVWALANPNKKVSLHPGQRTTVACTIVLPPQAVAGAAINLVDPAVIGGSLGIFGIVLGLGLGGELGGGGGPTTDSQ